MAVPAAPLKRSRPASNPHAAETRAKAEGQGFEPSVDRTAVNGFRDSHDGLSDYSNSLHAVGAALVSRKAQAGPGSLGQRRDVLSRMGEAEIEALERGYAALNRGDLSV